MFLNFQKSIKPRGLLFFMALLLPGCDLTESAHAKKVYSNNEIREKIYRHQSEMEYAVLPEIQKPKKHYPWEEIEEETVKAIAVSDFYCRGSSKNAPRKIFKNALDELECPDCGGKETHTLPLRNGQPFVYPVLVTLLNHIQTVTGRKVIITSAHRCPQHELYLSPLDISHVSYYSIGAAVDFYVQGLEYAPQHVIKIITDFYKGMGKSKFGEFQRIAIKKKYGITPWVNDELCLFIHSEKEDRNVDNAHGYPYVTILVHYDRDTQKKVEPNWHEALTSFTSKDPLSIRTNEE